MSSIQKFLNKKSTTTFDEASLWKIIWKMQENGKIDDKLKIINSIYEYKIFSEDSLDIHSKNCKDKSYNLEESVDIASINSKN